MLCNQIVNNYLLNKNVSNGNMDKIIQSDLCKKSIIGCMTCGYIVCKCLHNRKY